MIIGQSNSVYPEGSPVRAVLDVVESVPAGAARYTSFNFIWSSAADHSDAAIAIAASAALGRSYSDTGRPPPRIQPGGRRRCG